MLLALGTIAVPRPANTAPPPGYPRLRAAANELLEAKHELERAPHDFCGHRKEAVRATEAALREINASLACRR